MPRSQRQVETRSTGSKPAPLGSRRWTYSAWCLASISSSTSTSSPTSTWLLRRAARGGTPRLAGCGGRSGAATPKKSLLASAGSFSVEKCQVAEAKSRPVLSISTLHLGVARGLDLARLRIFIWRRASVRSGWKTTFSCRPANSTSASCCLPSWPSCFEVVGQAVDRPRRWPGSSSTG